MADLDGVSFLRSGGQLVPADANAGDFLESLKEGREVIVSVRRARSPQHHRLFFGVLKLVVDNSDDWPSVEVLLDELKMATGHFETRICLLTGRPYARPASINFAAMSQDEFRAFFDRAMDILASKIGYDPVEALHEYEAGLDPQAKRWVA